MKDKKHTVVGTYRHGHATCELKRSMEIPSGMRDGIREISGIHTPSEHRRNGDASALLREICDEADTQKLVLLLHVEPFGHGGMDAAGLEAWYSRFGFMVIQPEPKLMARMVGATPRLLNPVTAAVGRAIESY